MQLPEPGDIGELRRAWEARADKWIAWARAPDFDSYWLFNRDQFLEVVPPPGRLTLDIGAGEGRLARDLASRGHRVVAIEPAGVLATAARTADASIPVLRGDAARLPIGDAAADLAVAFMSLQDVDDMPEAVREAARVLMPGGRLCFAIVHPLNSAGSFTNDEPDSPFVVRGAYLDEFRYEDHIERDGLEMSFVSEHRPIQAYFDALGEAGLLVERLKEPAVPDHALEAPWARRWQRLPLFLHVAAVRR